LCRGPRDEIHDACTIENDSFERFTDVHIAFGNRGFKFHFSTIPLCSSILYTHTVRRIYKKGFPKEISSGNYWLMEFFFEIYELEIV